MRFSWIRTKDGFYIVDGKQGSIMQGADIKPVCICFDPDLADRIVISLNSGPRFYITDITFRGF